MSLLISVIVALLLAGFLLWLIQFLPVAEPFPTVAKGLIIFAMIFYVIAVLFGWAAPIALPLHR